MRTAHINRTETLERVPVTESPRAMFPSIIAIVMVAATVAACAKTSDEHDHPAGDPAQLGQVDFTVTCSPAVQPGFARAVAMQHSFWFAAADSAFKEIIATDSTCAMAHWGLAVNYMSNPMTRAAPTPDAVRAGAAAIARATELAGNASHREQLYIAAVAAYYAGSDSVDHLTRMLALEDGLAAVSSAHPEDKEAAIFFARTLVANAAPDDKKFSKQLRAASILEPLFEQHPNHPGLAHYLIHAYDAPAIADRGTGAARAYAEIAPAAPHALHMPSHIFTRLGHWKESIETNARSAAAEPVPDAAVHPMDYMVYAYLQLGQDSAANEVVARAVNNPDRFYGGLIGYNFAAMPARFALEREDWTTAAELKIPVSAPPFVEAVTRFARGIGAVRSGNVNGAKAEIAELERLRRALQSANDNYWSVVVEAQRQAVVAWVTLKEGDNAAAVQLAHAAADLEETVEKHPVTPGPILPARELAADLLLELGRHADAHAAYEQTLKREPRRARALYGAAHAAELAGNGAVASTRFRELKALMANADATRKERVAAERHSG